MRLDEVKRKTGSTTEEILGINEQPEPNCPFIDSFIEDIKKHLIYVHVDPKSHRLFLDLIEALEEIRDRFTQLRDWGQDWKDITKNLLEKHDVSFISEETWQKLQDY